VLLLQKFKVCFAVSFLILFLAVYFQNASVEVGIKAVVTQL